MVYNGNISLQDQQAAIAAAEMLAPVFQLPVNNNNMTGTPTWVSASGSVAKLVELGLFMLDVATISGEFIVNQIDMHGSIATYLNFYNDKPQHDDILFNTPLPFPDIPNLLMWLNSTYAINYSLTGIFKLATGINGNSWVWYSNPEHFRQINHVVTLGSDGNSDFSIDDFTQNDFS